MTDPILSVWPALAPALEAGRQFYDSLRVQGARPLAFQIGRADGTGGIALSLCKERLSADGFASAASAAELRLASRKLDSHDVVAFGAFKDALMQADLSTWKILKIQFTPCLDIVTALRAGASYYTVTSRIAGAGSYAMSRPVERLIPALRRMGHALGYGEARALIVLDDILPLASAHERLAVEESLAELAPKRKELEAAVRKSHGYGLWLRRDDDIVVIAARLGFDGDEHEILGAIDLRGSP